jgi:glycosyltransferase involved in cell wall biosynthesis
VGWLKICFLMYQGNMYSGGQGVYTYYLTRELARLGHEVHVIVGPPEPELAEEVIPHYLPSHSYWSYFYDRQGFLFRHNPLSHFHPVNFYEFVSTRIALSSLLFNFSVRAYLKLRELSREHRFDVVHDNQALSYGIWLMRLSGFPVVATVHHPLTIDLENALRQAGSPYEKARRILWSPWVMQQVVARRLDRLIVVSHASARSVERAFGVLPERLRVVHNGIDTEMFRPMDGLECRPNEILYVGNSEDRNKGARYLLEALDMLKEELDFHVTFVDNVRSRLRLAPRLVREFGLSSRVAFTGRVCREELVELYNRATLVVCPSLYEGFGLPAAEAMACGTPVLATTGGALPEVVEHSRTGWLVPPADSRALAEGIRLLLGAPELRERLGRAGYQEIRERFGWRRAAQDVVAVYEEAMAARRSSARPVAQASG